MPKPSMLRLLLGIAVALVGIVLLVVLSSGVRGLFFLDSPRLWTTTDLALALPGWLCFLAGFFAAAVDLRARQTGIFIRGNPLGLLITMVLGAALLLPFVRRRQTATATIAAATASVTVIALGLVSFAMGISHVRYQRHVESVADRPRPPRVPAIEPAAIEPVATEPVATPVAIEPVIATPPPKPPRPAPRKPPPPPQQAPADMFE